MITFAELDAAEKAAHRAWLEFRASRPQNITLYAYFVAGYCKGRVDEARDDAARLAREREK
jgi:hypothetical protein